MALLVEWASPCVRRGTWIESVILRNLFSGLLTGDRRQKGDMQGGPYFARVQLSVGLHGR